MRTFARAQLPGGKLDRDDYAALKARSEYKSLGWESIIMKLRLSVCKVALNQNMPLLEKDSM